MGRMMRLVWMRRWPKMQGEILLETVCALSQAGKFPSYDSAPLLQLALTKQIPQPFHNSRHTRLGAESHVENTRSSGSFAGLKA
jgi:hypothetical protein